MRITSCLPPTGPMALAAILAAIPTMGRAPAQQVSGEGVDQVQSAPAPELPEQVQKLFDQVGSDGKPVIGEKLHKYFLALPEHARRLFAAALDNDIISGAAHARVLLSLQLDADKMELVLSDNCILCHTDEESQEEETLFTLSTVGDASFGPSHLSLRDVLSDVHFRRGLSCSGCHGGAPTDMEMADEIYSRWPDADKRHVDRTWIPAFCARCHSDPGFMRKYNPALPTDQLAKYRTSQHGKLLLEKSDSAAAQCVSCHGVHGIRAPDSRRSMVHPQNIPATCGSCHASPRHMNGYKLADGTPIPTNQLEQYRKSIHGIALLQNGDLGAPACNDCHGNHAAMPPQVAFVSQVCRTCHAGNGAMFDGSKHKLAFREHGWPECGQCHGKHDIAKASDDMLAPQPGGLCHDCHSEYARDNPSCTATATEFHDVIHTLKDANESFQLAEHTLAARGHDVDPLIGVLNELHDALRQARSAIHAFDRSDFDEVAAAGMNAVRAGREVIASADRDFSFRRKGMIIAIACMAFLALVIYLKLRRLEGRGRSSKET